jgi:hypothetical protein
MSFGTNDLTQTALGISRDDMANFLMPYTENEVFKKNPFATLDVTGVGQLMRIANEIQNLGKLAPEHLGSDPLRPPSFREPTLHPFMLFMPFMVKSPA